MLFKINGRWFGMFSVLFEQHPAPHTDLWAIFGRFPNSSKDVDQWHASGR